MSDWTPERIAELTRLAATGMSQSHIGDRIGFSKNQVAGKMRRLKLKTRGGGVPFKLAPMQPGKPRLSNGINRPHVPLTAYTGPRAGTGCKWPHDDFRERIRHGQEPFCDAPAIEGTSWCPEHRRKVYVRA